jgi:hypothetical protein
MIDPPTDFGAQTSGSIYDAATAEIESNLSQFSVSVICTGADGVTTITDPTLCVSGDLLTVTVKWHRDPLTLVGVTDTVSGSSTRTVVELP